MSREPSLAEMIDWIMKLDDTYKIFLLSTLYALFLYSILFIGVDITQEGIYALTINTFIIALANMVKYHLIRLILDGITIVVSFIFYLIGLNSLFVSFYRIWTYRLLGIVIALTGFFGWFLLFVLDLKLQLNNIYINAFCLGLVIVSAVLAKLNSNLKFDNEGRAIME